MRVISALFALFALSASLTVAAQTTQRVYLSGHGSNDATPWDFYCTGGRNSGFWTQIAVPSCWEQQGFGAYDYGVEVRLNKYLIPPADEQGIYRHRFPAPADWQGKAVRLVFAGVMTDTEVKINGQTAGPIHQGGFYQFHYDISNQLHYGAENDIEVRVSKQSANASVNRAERIGDFWNFGGIFRPVYLEVAPAAFIERVAIDARADGTFRAQVFPHGPLSAGAEINLQLKTLDGEPVGNPVHQTIAPGSVSGEIITSLPQAKTWTAETPVLYQAEFTLRLPDGKTHEFTERFGFRTIEVRPNDGIYVNGSKITLKGINRHSFWPDTGRTLSSQNLREDVQLLKEANINAVRMSHYPPDAEFLDLCDEAGLYVLDELTGWQAYYDTPIGRKLVGEMVQRDVNHPSVLFWDNGNEGGFNTELDDEFAKYDPQNRTVVHPGPGGGYASSDVASFRGLNTKHYRDYKDTVAMAESSTIFLPTEFLHGMYDGGAGAGLDDYWHAMGEKPHAAGGFIWAFLDEAVKRMDQGGKLDSRRDLAPDGIVGPYREKEGSFYTIRQIWSPVQIPLEELPADFQGTVPVRNRYDFRNLQDVTFEWSLTNEPPPGALKPWHTLVAYGRTAGPNLPPRQDGSVSLKLPDHWRDADLLSLSAFDPEHRELWRWTWQWKKGAASLGSASPTKAATASATIGAEIILSSGRNTARFNKTNGQLLALTRDGQSISLSGGPRLVAYRRTERTLLPVTLPAAENIHVETLPGGETATIKVVSDGALKTVNWTLQPDGDLRLDYAFEGPGSVDLLGVDFAYPEEKMKAKEWLGGGPYRVWQNRLKGTQISRWDTRYNDPIPGENWDYPEFKGWFSHWRWVAFTTTEGRFALINESGQSYFGAYSPRDGQHNPILVLPRTGLGVYQVIPAIGSKLATPDKTGPQGQPQTITGDVKGTLIIRLLGGI